MIFRMRLKAVCILLALSFGIVVSAGCFNHVESSGARRQSDDIESLKAELAKYRNWTLVNPQPVLMDPIVAVACAAPSIGTPSPHSNKYVLVYVNEAGKAAMMSEKHPRFPPGAIIVKEKFSEETNRLPELLTIMVKRAEGFDPGNGNWEYWVAEGDLSRVQRPGNVKSCQGCHLAKKETDYVSRIYLPKEIREKLK